MTFDSTRKFVALSLDRLLKQQPNKQQQVWGGNTTVHKQISGTVSVAFTPMQGLEIVNPKTAGFVSVMNYHECFI